MSDAKEARASAHGVDGLLVGGGLGLEFLVCCDDVIGEIAQTTQLLRGTSTGLRSWPRFDTPHHLHIPGSIYSDIFTMGGHSGFNIDILKIDLK